MSEPSSIDSPRTLEAPDGFQAEESWGGRFLDWLYPSRGWAGAQPVTEPSPGIDRALKARPTPGKPAGFETGDTR